MKYDVIVGGAGPSGICAAIAAKRGGANVLLIENSGLLGGTNILSLVGPLMTYHNMKNQVIRGIAEEIIERLNKINGTLGHIVDPLGFCSTVTPIDTEALKRLYFELIQENNIDLLLHTKIIGAHQEDGNIKYITVANKEGVYNIEATYFIDATGDGDIAHYANAEYIIGRTSDNLCQPMTMPFVVSNVDINKLDKLRDIFIEKLKKYNYATNIHYLTRI
jgi:flavin-dependent dehydrogenase